MLIFMYLPNINMFHERIDQAETSDHHERKQTQELRPMVNTL